MPKIKTKKSIRKRVAKITGTSRILRRKTVSQHLCSRKSKRTKKNSGRKTGLTKADERKIRAQVPYGK
ncbi:MAG: 50S ribosomal protein L35 [Candidatus Berkelbacteria bacterium]|nr:50S ribosomal protein L35 [Candidatus Berkelbacteria bacterium]